MSAGGLKHKITYPELWTAGAPDYVDRPYILEGKKFYQQCYVCGRPIVFAREGGKWMSIGGGLIRHKDCEPPYQGGKL
jgi:hypothetical protein